MGSPIELVYVGWHGPLLPRVARWILDRFGDDGARLSIALPGSRAARALREELARAAPPSWIPPAIVTPGQLVDELVLVDAPIAGRLARTLAWSRALRDLPAPLFDALVARRPADPNLREWLALAAIVRTLHAELAQEGLGFADVVQPLRALGRASEVARFEALAEAQGRWRARLADAGFADPHEARSAALDSGRIDPERRVVLVGVADANRLVRRLLAHLGPRATALVCAPPEEGPGFDEFGCVRTAAWRDRELDLPAERWHVVSGPDDAADGAIAALTRLAGRFAPEEITLGVLDEEVAPRLQRRLAEVGIVARLAAGEPIERTRPVRLLAETARFLGSPNFAALARLARHADVEAALRADPASGELDPASALDLYQSRHLPSRADRAFAGGSKAERVRAGIARLLGEIAEGDARPVHAWTEPLRAFLSAVYAASDLDPAREESRVLGSALESVGLVLREVARVPRAFAEEPVRSAVAIELVLAELAGERVPPRPSASGEAALDLVGWLDLPLDGARAVVVTGFQDGRVPESERADPFLPDGLRRALGLPCADDRLARDVYAATLIREGRGEVDFVSARASRRGDPLLPSRLAFHVPRERLVERVEHWVKGGRAASALEDEAGGRPYVLPFHPASFVVGSMRVTAFKDYIASPYYFYLKNVLELETLDDREREMDARVFGIFAHEVLAAFGQGAARDARDADPIAEFLCAETDRLGTERFGDEPLVAVSVQLEALKHRWRLFADWQATRARAGWRIEHAEWNAPLHALELQTGSTPMLLTGRIDRIDVHEDGKRWAILDYKTSAKAQDPAKTHRGRDGWRDLQLPLYTLLAMPLGRELLPELGYVCVGCDEPNIGHRLANWSETDVESAHDAARDIARRVRNGEWSEIQRFPSRGPVFDALIGRGLVGIRDPDDGEADGDGAGDGSES